MFFPRPPRALLVALACASALRFEPGLTIGRRQLLAGGALALAPAAASAKPGFKDIYEGDKALLSGGAGVNESYALPQFGEDGSIVGAGSDDIDTAYRSVRSGKASVQVLSNWKQAADGSLSDPVAGGAARSLAFSVAPIAVGSVADLGRPEQLDLVKSFGLEATLKRADLVAAAVRSANGVKVYEFDLALPALDCVPELATACLPTLVVLLAACVRDGQLHVLRVDADPGQWRRSGAALKALRSSFAVEAA